MEIITDSRVDKFIKKLNEIEKGRVLRYLDLLDAYGFTLSSKYLKKLTNRVWELRPGNIRLLLGKSKISQTVLIVNVFKKKTQKTPKKEIETANTRLKQYNL